MLANMHGKKKRKTSANMRINFRLHVSTFQKCFIKLFQLIRMCILSVTSHINCFGARRPDKQRWLSHSMCLYQVMMTLLFLNDVANDTKSTQKSIITS